MANEPTKASTASPLSRSTGVYAKAALCLVVGLTFGYLFRGLQSSAPAKSVVQAGNPSARESAISSGQIPKLGVIKPVLAKQSGAMSGRRLPTLAEMKQMADTQAAPLLEKLKTDPNNSALLSQVGAIYHSTHQFNQAAIYYNKALQTDPKNVAIRTKLASSLYRGDDVDGAIRQLNQALIYDPRDANALFDLGIIKLHGKQDGKGALAAWQQLLKSNPQLSADRKATVQKMIAAVLTMLSDQNGIQGARSNDQHKPETN